MIPQVVDWIKWVLKGCVSQLSVDLVQSKRV